MKFFNSSSWLDSLTAVDFLGFPFLQTVDVVSKDEKMKRWRNNLSFHEFVINNSLGQQFTLWHNTVVVVVLLPLGKTLPGIPGGLSMSNSTLHESRQNEVLSVYLSSSLTNVCPKSLTILFRLWRLALETGVGSDGSSQMMRTQGTDIWLCCSDDSQARYLMSNPSSTLELLCPQKNVWNKLYTTWDNWRAIETPVEGVPLNSWQEFSTSYNLEDTSSWLAIWDEVFLHCYARLVFLISFFSSFLLIILTNRHHHNNSIDFVA